MAAKEAERMANKPGSFKFSAFRMSSNGAMVVERSKLHSSEGYQRQVKALAELSDRRKNKAK